MAETSPPLFSARRSLLAFVLPLVVYMLLGNLEPDPLPPSSAALPSDEVLGDLTELEGDDFPEEVLGDSDWPSLPLPGEYYPLIYTGKIIATLLVLACFWPVYRQWPLRVSPLAIGVGVVGVLLWIGCCWLNLEGSLVGWLGEDHVAISWLGLGNRPSYNPLAALADSPNLKYGFLAIRFFGLALLIPIIEEAFLRAFLMRYVIHDNWTEIPFGIVNRMAIAAGILLPVLYHPEKLAALLWFSLVTWLMIRTKNFWDCVVAHAVTNLLLGIYVVMAGKWELW